MQPVVISATIQEFDGLRYYLCGRYFQRDGNRLHLVVWKHHNGPAPPGHHVHHIDNDRANNRGENLECISRHEHLVGRHGADNTRRSRERGMPPEATKAAAAWHGTEAGKKWHSENFDRNVRHIVAERITLTCQQCGAAYTASRIKRAYSRFCCGACKARAWRQRAAFRLDELDHA